MKILFTAIIVCLAFGVLCFNLGSMLERERYQQKLEALKEAEQLEWKMVNL